jgi:hypothetical protein
MIRTSANTENTLWVNASRNKTLSNPTYMMGIQHQVNSNFVKRFIPQNVTPQSGTTIENPRVDLFNVTFSGSGENLTGGTRAWYYQISPTIQYSGLTQSANKDNRYIFMSWEANTPPEGEWGVYIDSPNVGEVVTGGTWTIDGVSVPLEQILDFGKGNIGISVWVDGSNTSGTTYEYSFTTNSGRTFSDTLYLASMDEIDEYKPWDYYTSSPCNVSILPSEGCISFPTTYLGKTTVDIEDYGWYYYKIYEQTSKINLNPSLATDIVDEGILYIIPPETTQVEYTGYSNNNITIYE